jgi:hypothetical protein
MVRCALGLIGQIDLSLAQSCQELLRCDVDQFNLVGSLQYRVRHGLANNDVSDLSNDVIEAFEMLDIDCRKDIDTRVEDL